MKETKAPANYYRNTNAKYEFTFNSLEETKATATFKHTFKNNRTTAKIQIQKVDSETGKPVPQGDASLEGAIYGLYARENIVHPDGATGVIYKKDALVATLTTDKDGKSEISDLYLGKYYVKEISASELSLLTMKTSQSSVSLQSSKRVRCLIRMKVDSLLIQTRRHLSIKKAHLLERSLKFMLPRISIQQICS